jgi:lysine 6-dehydrogenase
MKVLVLGCGLQGRAVVHDLAASAAVEQVVVADADLDAARAVCERFGGHRLRPAALDAADPAALRALVDGGYDVVVDMLPRQFIRNVGKACIAAGVHMVNTYYDHDLRDLDAEAREAGVALLPEMGLDPGIDLVMAAHAIRRFDRVTHLLSYGGGIPEAGADDNPLRYRISWTWEGVLNAYARPSKLVHRGVVVEVPAANIFDESNVHTVEVPPFGSLEAYPNGDAADYAQRFGIADSAREVGRYALRWPGHVQLWRALVGLGFLEQEPVPGLRGISPREFMIRHLEPRLGYSDSQRDAVILRVEARGEGGAGQGLVLELIDYRDLDTGLMAMNRTVGFPASIAAQMLADGRISARGLLSPIQHMPWEALVEELSRRGIGIVERAG